MQKKIILCFAAQFSASFPHCETGLRSRKQSEVFGWSQSRIPNKHQESEAPEV